MSYEGLEESGAHDVGGMAGFGNVFPEPFEPIFHGRWEARVLAMTLAVAAWRKWTLDASRFTRESIPRTHYLAMSYYQIWLAGLVSQMVEAGLITEQELFSGKPAPGPRLEPPLTADRVGPALRRGGSTLRDTERKPAFELGKKVLTLTYQPTGHTRMPSYAHGRCGVIEQRHGNHVFPDTNAHGAGENPQPLYGVRFEARDLWWGAQADPRHSVRLDLFEDYLTPA